MSTVEHVRDELLALLNGELAGAALVRCGQHIRNCPACAHDLVDAAVVHGSIRATRHAEEEVGLVVSGAPKRSSAPATERAGLRRARGGTRRFLLMSAAAVVVVTVVAVAASLLAVRTPAESPVAEVAGLRPLEAPTDAGGTVVVRTAGSTREMLVTTAGLPTPPPDHFYEVWLLEPSTNKMAPVGMLDPSGRSVYGIAAPVMAQYLAVDISLQANDGDPAHSATSVLRGTFGPST